MGQRFSNELVRRRLRYALSGRQPAAGADWSVTIPGGFTYRLLAISAQLVTSAAAPVRTPILTISADGGAIFATPPVATIAASLTTRLSWAPGVTPLNVGNTQVLPIPPLTLEGGATVAIATGGIDVGDQWGIPQLFLVQDQIMAGPTDLEGQSDAAVDLVAIIGG